MSEPQQKSNSPLLQGISQFEVDFVIPRLGDDLPLGIDPFLLFKSRDVFLSNLHSILLDAFNYGVDLVRKNKIDEARVFLTFPEVSEIGLGYTKKGKKGGGVGPYLTELIIESLIESPSLLERGIKHIEEMQLFSVNIARDRISDITANILKQYLIEYTQKQCELWKIPLVTNVPIENIFDTKTANWYDGYFDLPISPYDKSPILFVPRRIVRTLPWINYKDYFRMEFSAYLRAKRVRGKSTTKSHKVDLEVEEYKDKVVAITRNEVERVDRYISSKEASASQAQPSLNYVDKSEVCPESESLKERLGQIKPGRTDATAYQRLILEIFNFLFNPELIDGELEVETIDGTERRDIIFTNDSDQTFWTYLRTRHLALLLMLETKNTETITNFYINQVATYLGERLGYIGFIITRNPIEEAQFKKAFSVYNDSTPRKIILMLSDLDIKNMLDIKCQGKEPMQYIQNLYRTFITKVQ